jgi:hypothetical protein
MEIDEEWQTGRRYMKINKEDQLLQEDDPHKFINLLEYLKAYLGKYKSIGLPKITHKVSFFRIGVITGKNS